MNEYINLDEKNIEEEHICCAIGDPKHQDGVDKKKEWIKNKLKDGHVFRKLNARGKIFIEYEPIETAWVPINGKKILHEYNADDKILYIQYPLCIQRKPYNRPWMNKSPYYRFVGIPNMYADFEKWGLIDSAHDLWMNRGNTRKEFLSIMSQTSVFKQEYRPLFKVMIKSQYSFTRKALTFFFVFISPSWLYKFIRRKVFK